MENLLIGLNVFLGILVIVAIIAAIIFYRDTRECETNESPYCPQYVCPNGAAATRKTADGRTQFSENPLPKIKSNS